MMFFENTVLHQGALLKDNGIGLVKLSRFHRFDQARERARELVRDERKEGKVDDGRAWINSRTLRARITD